MFAFRAKRWHLFFDSIMASTTKWYTGGYVLWTLPIGLKLPVNDARCAYVGTIVVHISGEPPNYPFFIWQAGAKEDTHVKATVVDNYERDRAALASYVAGCDLQRALAEPITAEDVRALFGPPPAGQARRAR